VQNQALSSADPITLSPAGAAVHQEVGLANFCAVWLEDFDVEIVHVNMDMSRVGGAIACEHRRSWSVRCHARRLR
jgi:hypothetical protein